MPNIVVMIDPSEQEALRSGGVLPPGMFRSFDDLPENDVAGQGDDHSVYLWPYPVDYSPMADENAPESLPSLLGLPEVGEEELASERYAARLFGADVFHVVFLDSETSGPKGGAAFSGRKTSFGSLSDVVKWSERLKRAVLGRLHQEQADLVRHYMILVARGGQVVTTAEEAERLQQTFEDKSGCLRACFFLDFNPEVERGNVLVHSTYVWPAMVGRLLLRFVLDNARTDCVSETHATGEDAPAAPGGAAEHQGEPLRAPGVHLWRATEFLFGYPKDRLLQKWRDFTKAAFRAIRERNTLASGGQDPVRGGKALEDAFKEYFTSPNDLTSVLPEKPKPPCASKQSWDDVSVSPWVKWALNDDRWTKPVKDAVGVFQEELLKASHRSWGSFGGKSVWYSPQDAMTKRVFARVDETPSEVWGMSNRIEEGLPNLKTDKDPFDLWKFALKKEKERTEAKSGVEWAGREMKSAQDHFVPIDLGLLAAGAVSLSCGFAIHRVVMTVGGSLALSILLSSLVLAGSVLAVLAVHFFHGRAGRRGLDAFLSLCHEVDDRMEVRNEALFATINAAAQCHDIAERRSTMGANLDLLKRIRRILGREVETPTVGVFFDETDADKKKSVPDEGKKQREILMSRTRFTEDLSGVLFTDGDAKKADKVVDEYFPGLPGRTPGDKAPQVDPEDGKFQKTWKDWCTEADQGRWGNYPADFFIPRLRRFMQGFCDSVADALKDDVLDKRNSGLVGNVNLGPNVPPPKLQEELSEGNLSGFVFASAHVDDEQVQNDEKGGVLYVSGRFFDKAKSQFENRQDFDVFSSRAFSALPHYAFYFQDIHVRLGCAETGRGGKNVPGRLIFACKRARKD